MKVPFFDMQRHLGPLRKDVDLAIKEVIDSGRFIGGPAVQGFEAGFADMIGVKHSVSVSSGTDALLSAMMALGICPGDEVITSAFTFFATAGSIYRTGATPVFADILPDTFELDPASVMERITPRTKAVVPVHLFGLTTEIQPYIDAGLTVIEDAAQAVISRGPEGPAGGIGRVGCFSFFPAKNLGAFGDAGAVTTNDPKLAERVRAVRTHGATKKYFHPMVGGNFRMDSIQAAILSVEMPFLNAWTGARRKNAAAYAGLFRESGLVPKGLVALPKEPEGYFHVYNQYVVRTAHRDKLKEHLDKAGVQTAIYYPLSLHEQECFKDLGYRHGDLPATEKACTEVLALPIYPELRRDELEAVVTEIINFYKGL